MVATPPSIIGIVLVKNEDLFIDGVLTNILDFCDEIIVADNLSKDGTQEKVRVCRSTITKFITILLQVRRNLMI